MTSPVEVQQAELAGRLARPMAGAFVLGSVHLLVALVFASVAVTLGATGALALSPFAAGMVMGALVYWATGAGTVALRRALRRGEQPDMAQIRRYLRLPYLLRNIAPIPPVLLALVVAAYGGDGDVDLLLALVGCMMLVQPAAMLKSVARLASRPPAHAIWSPRAGTGPAGPPSAPPALPPGRMRLTLGPGPLTWAAFTVMLVLLVPVWGVGLVVLTIAFGGWGTGFFVALPLSLVVLAPAVVLSARIYRRAWWLDGTVLVQRKVRGELRCDLSTAQVAAEAAPAILLRGPELLPRLVAGQRGRQPLRLWLRDPDRRRALLPAAELLALAQAVSHGREDDPRIAPIAEGLRALAADPSAV
ncbi:hypothetical protein [Actinomadura sp. NTSP31]|uniref:hypothetical protein n=1 Tax=Actinomadura sp. NTSP31 TaxID=1735447 RepID=UPI0035BEC501